MGARSGHPDLVAVVDDALAARRCIERLSRAGVDGGAIRLLGRVEVTTAGRAGDRQTDRGSSLALGGRALRGAMVGSVPGALFGALVLALSSADGPLELLAGAGGGAGFGAGVGALVGMLSLPMMATSWERTFAPLVPGGVAVGIAAGDLRTLVRARRVLRRSGARSVHEVHDLDELPDVHVTELEHPVRGQDGAPDGGG